MIDYVATEQYPKMGQDIVAELSPAAEHRFVTNGGVEPDQAKMRMCVFPQRIFPVDGGKVLLRTYSDLELLVNERAETFEVKDWGIQLRCDLAHELPKKVVHKFLTLLSKAESRTLNNDERARWMTILDQVDFQQFSIDRAQPHYFEGQLIARRPGQPAVVEWVDGTRSNIPAKIAVSLAALNQGDDFSAFVKFGRNNEVLALETVSLVVS